ncbi:MAG TPA: citrate synthase, partial [Longimicrobiaceae bacterium]|nr:citrate synthase [Longimicrobiaceae bacterium]
MSSNPTAGPPTAATLSAEQAARLLGISRRTLYAYVSRGLLTSMADPGGVRTRRYPAAAVRRLAALRDARRDPAQGARAAARGALAWGDPVLDSAITLVSGGRYFYRGHDALALAEQAAASPSPAAGGHFERVAELLLRGTLPATARLEPADDGVAATLARVREIAIGRPLPPVRTALAAL